MSINTLRSWQATKTSVVTFSDYFPVERYDTPEPVEIRLHQRSRVLTVRFADGAVFELPCEYLRVFSPSAEVKGHGPGQEVLQSGKANVNITAIEPVGQYAVRLIFDDGHDTGLYSWNLLYQLGRDQVSNWQQYLERLQQAGASRTPPAKHA